MKINAIDYENFLKNNIDRLSQESTPLWHPLGFVSCIIYSESNQYTLRLHYWPTNERRTKNPDWPIHTHSYALSSLILSGSVQDIQYSTTHGHNHPIYRVEYSNEHSEIVKTNEKISLIESTNKTQGKGSQYSIPRGTFHQTKVALGKSALTLVAMSQFGKTFPLVIGDDAGDRYPYEREPFDSATFWFEVKKALTETI